MDRLIKRYNAVNDPGNVSAACLTIAAEHGVAYQTYMGHGRVPYDASYLAKVDAYDRTPIATAVNKGRCEFMARHLPLGASVLDIGAGSGAMVRDMTAAGWRAKGYDVIPDAIGRLMQNSQFAEDPYQFDATTMWDAIEHIENPEPRLRTPKGAYLFASLPIFEDLSRIRESKHYRPGEHLYYWTAAGFTEWMALYGFRLLEQSNHEIEAGREAIGAFAFKRDLPDYHDHVAAYREMHDTRHYGSSAVELHLDTVANLVRRLQPTAILDYGCGRSDLAAHFWKDGERRIARYDPAIGKYKRMPEGAFDLVLCCDVMEHIPMAYVDQILTDIRNKSPRAIFTISTKLARAKLPDGRNAHVTILTKPEWTRWIADYFGPVEEIPCEWEHELILLAGTKP